MFRADSRLNINGHYGMQCLAVAFIVEKKTQLSQGMLKWILQLCKYNQRTIMLMVLNIISLVTMNNFV